MLRPRFEDAPYARPPDETDVTLRAYFDAMPDEKPAEYRAALAECLQFRGLHHARA